MLDPCDGDAAWLLMRVRPSPREDFVIACEARLLGDPQRGQSRLSLRSLVPAAALTSAFVTGVLAAGLAGSGPLASSGSEDAQGDCEAVTRTIVGGSEIVRGVDGEVRVAPLKAPVTATVRRCR